MHFEFVHDFDIARDAVELAVLSPRLIEKIAPIHLAVPGRVRVQYIDPVLHLQQMTYYL